MSELVILTGISGAGKSTCLFAFEEMDFYCIENCPLPIIPNLIDLIISGDPKYQRVVVAINASDALSLIHMAQKIKGLHMTSIFLDAKKSELLSRYKLTRHVHPLQVSGLSLEEAISAEKSTLRMLRPEIDLFIDTTGLSVTAFRKLLFKHFSLNNGLTVSFMSFGYKHGVPSDVDLIFDMRTLPNPYYIPELKALTGNDDAVKNYVLSLDSTQELLRKITDFLDYFLRQVKEEGRAYFVVGIGCSGGQHRSVALANYLATYYEKEYMTIVNHRDLPKANL